MKSILFKPWKIKAIADSSPDFEWQTRRLAGLKEINQEPDRWAAQYCNPQAKPDRAGDYWLFLDKERYLAKEPIKVKPRFRVGEIVYIKETHYAYGCWEHLEEGWVFSKDPDMKVVVDDADWKHALKGHNSKQGWYKRSPMFMFATDARYFVRITGVRVERLQEITLEDCVYEGLSADYRSPAELRESYQVLWDSINPKHPWSKDEWVMVYSFKKVNHKEE